MFTRAGYNLRGACRWKFWAKVLVVDGTNRRGWSQVVEFASGDLAWYSWQGRFMVWGHRVWVEGYLPGTFEERYRNPRSRLPE